jgi:hypothetical protein
MDDYDKVDVYIEHIISYYFLKIQELNNNSFR